MIKTYDITIAADNIDTKVIEELLVRLIHDNSSLLVDNLKFVRVKEADVDDGR
jgi:hypothetical protein